MTSNAKAIIKEPGLEQQQYFFHSLSSRVQPPFQSQYSTKNGYTSIPSKLPDLKVPSIQNQPSDSLTLNTEQISKK